MENSLLWQAFTTLKPLEIKHLGQWLQSPFFCRRKEPGILLDYLRECRQKNELPVAETAALRIFQSAQKSETAEYRLVASELLDHLEHFLVYQEKSAQLWNDKLHLAVAYRKRGLEKHFQRSLRESYTLLERQPYRHAEYYEARQALEYEQYQFLSIGRRTVAFNLQELTHQTDVAFLAAKLRQACFAMSHKTVYRTEYDFGLLQPVLDYLPQIAQERKFSAVALYYYCYKFLINSDDDESFTAFRQLFRQHIGELPPEEQRNLHLLALNFCIKKINQLQIQYFTDAFELYRSALDGNLLLENGILSPFAFNNIVVTALKVGEAEWAGQFIENYAPYLEKKQRSATSHLNLARVAYHRRAFKEALLHLQQADYKDAINNLIAKTLQMKIYYETAEWDTLDDHLESMRKYLRRHRNIGYHKTNYTNIVRLTQRLIELPPANRAERENLRQQINAESQLTEKEWLLEMIGK